MRFLLFDDWKSWRRSGDIDRYGEFDKDKTSIVCNLMIEDLWGVRILEEWGSWRGEDLGGMRILEEWGPWRSKNEIGGEESKKRLALFAIWWLRILEEWGRDWQKWGVWHRQTSMVCILLIEDFVGVRMDLWGVKIFEERRSWRSRDEIGGQEEFIKDKLTSFATWWLRILEESNDMMRWGAH